MTIQELEAMLATITTEQMGKVLTMKMPEDKTGPISESISTLTARVDNIEKERREEKVVETVKDAEEATTEYFNDLLK